MHRHPSSENLTSYFECLRTSAALAADPGETPASKIIEGLSGEVTVISYAALAEPLGFETSTSAGRVRALSLPKPPPASKRTDKDARRHASKTALCNRLWRLATSPHACRRHYGDTVGLACSLGIVGKSEESHSQNVNLNPTTT